ncbi:MAG: peptidylprolyl isomerase [Polyangiales bacterium]
MADKLKGFFLVLLVVLLSAVFALQFGGGQAEGCAAGGSTYLARVYDTTLSRGDFDAAYAIGNFGRLPAETQRAMGLPELVLNGLIDRTLLAREARKVGFDISEDEVMSRFVDGGVILLSLGVEAPPEIPQGEIPVSFSDKDGTFNVELAKRYIENGLRRSVGEFVDGQLDEHLAAQMRELVASVVNVSDAETWDDYVRENDKADVQYVRFSPAFYGKQKPDMSDAAIEKWIAEHQAEVDAEYEANKYRYTNLDKQVRSQHILVKTGSSATDDEKAAAEEKAIALQKRASAPGTDFSALAQAESSDRITAPQGGDLGYLTKGTMPDGFDAAVFAMEVGEVSDVVETDFGYHIIKVTGVREGDVPVDEAKRELAESVYVDGWVESRARAAAERALLAWASQGEDALSQRLSQEAKTSKGSSLTPTLEATGEFGRGAVPLAGLPTNVLLDAVFALEEGEAFPSEPVRVGREWVIFKVLDRERPTAEAFTDDLRESTREVLRTIKKNEAIDLYIRRLREQAVAEDALRINPLQTPDGNS